MSLVSLVTAELAIADQVGGCVVTSTGVTRTTSDAKFGTACVSHGTSLGHYDLSGNFSAIWNNGFQPVGDAVRGADFTIEMWFKFTEDLSPTPSYILEFTWTDNNLLSGDYLINQTRVSATERTIALYDGNADITSAEVSIASGIWHHMAVVFDNTASKIRFLANGAVVDGDFYRSNMPYPNGATSASISVLGVDGYTDDVGISSTAKYVGATGATYTVPGSLADANAAHAIVSVSPPMPIVTMYSGSVAILTAPSPSLYTTTGGNTTLTSPKPLLYAQGHNSFGEQAAFLTAPSPTLVITTGANSKLTAPSPTLSTSATGTIWGAADLSAPSPTLVAAGTVTELASASLTAPSPNLIGYGGAVCSITLTGRASVQATGTTGGIGGAQITAPLFELTASGTAQNYGSANLLAPSPKLGGQAQAWLIAPMGRLTAIGSAVITATYEAYAVNLKHTPRGNEQPIDEVTRYTNFPFTHVVRYKNSYYGVNDTGLYLLEGTTDETAPIPWAVKTAMDDFKNPMKKTVASAYFGGRFGPASTVQLHAGEQTPNTYSFTTPRDTLAQNYRQVFGKGVKERYYALGASGTGTVELDNIELETHNMTRRI